MPHELVLQSPRGEAPRPSFIPRQINIYHPGYENDPAPLLLFWGYDSTEGDLWHDFAQVACAIISNNRFDGWLSTSRDPQSSRCSGELLAPGDYWWHLPGGKTTALRCAIRYLHYLDSTEPYAVVPDFRSWQFPRVFPEAWKTHVAMAEQPETKCQVSQEVHTLTEAHIVPSSETDWFLKSGLVFSYGLDMRFGGTELENDIDNPNNLILLRSDLHHAWDQGNKFTFMPKRTKEGLEIVVHCWNRDMVTNYHNVPLQGFVCREFLLARLAWTLLPSAIKHFLWGTKEARMLWIRDDHGKLVPQKKTVEQCLAIANAFLSRSTSPQEAQAE